MEKVEISHKTIIFIVLFLASLWFLYQIRQIILFLFISIIFTTALGPIVNKLEKFNIPRGLAIAFVYLLIFGGFILAFMSTVPILISQTTALLEDLPQFLNKIGFYKLNIEIGDYSEQLAKIPVNIFKIISSIFSNIVGIFAFLVITFYLLMERKNLKKHLHSFFGEKGEKKIERLVFTLEKKLGGWIRGQLFLMFIVGLMSYIGLTLLDLDFILPLALVAGFFELIPNIGPTISMVPAVIVGFASSPIIGLAVIALYFLIQQIENNLIVPKVMQKAVGLHPLVTLIALMIGFKIGGIGGSILAVPTTIFIRVFIEHFCLPLSKKRSPFRNQQKSLGNP